MNYYVLFLLVKFLVGTSCVGHIIHLRGQHDSSNCPLCGVPKVGAINEKYWESKKSVPCTYCNMKSFTSKPGC